MPPKLERAATPYIINNLIMIYICHRYQQSKKRLVECPYPVEMGRIFLDRWVASNYPDHYFFGPVHLTPEM